MRPVKLIQMLLSLLVVVTLLAGNAQAALLDVGPTVPEVLNSSPPKHGFPLWYRDTDRVPLELCLSRATSPNVLGAQMCTLLPGPTFDMAQPMVFPTNFPDEVFWWTGDARAKSTKIGSRLDGALTMALEGALSTGFPGSQVTFARIRYRIETDVAGTYTITHPYGSRTFFNVPAGPDAINYTEDIGITVGKFDGLLQGRIGPFLIWDSGAPINVNGELFVGDPSVPHTVTGSPLGNNFFRIEGPGAPADNFAETSLFNISGKIYSPPIPTPLKGDRVAYARDIGGMQVNVFATTQPFSNATIPTMPFPANFSLTNTPSALLLSSPVLADTTMVTNSPVDGKFFTVTNRFAAPGTIPATVRISNTTDAPPYFIDPKLTDWVTIGSATYSKLNNSLMIAASSSDSVAPPLLTAFISGTTVSLGNLVAGQLVVPVPFTDNTVTPAKTYSIPPESITVKSVAGGTASAPVVTFTLPPLAP